MAFTRRGAIRLVPEVAAALRFAVGLRTITTTAGSLVDVRNGAHSIPGVVPLALEVGLAIVGCRRGGAALGADFRCVVPDALFEVGFAASLSCVGVLALLDARAGASFAHVVVVAFLGGGEVFAGGLAGTDGGIPHAHAVVDAVAHVGVLELAAGEALAAGANELAERIGFAGFFRSSVEFAALAAFVALRIPGAALEFVVEASLLVATSDALLGAGETNKTFGFSA